MELYQIILLVLAAIVAGLYIYKRITGKDILRGVMLSRPVVSALGAAVEAVCNIWPDKKILKTIHTVMKAAIEGAEIAEKAWKMGNLEKDERNAYAKKLVKETLAKAGIEITPQIELIIGGVIEAVCILLPHENNKTEEEVPVTPVVRGDEI